MRNRLTAAQQNLRSIDEELRDYDEIDEDDFLDEERDAYIRLRRRATNARRVVKDREFEYFNTTADLFEKDTDDYQSPKLFDPDAEQQCLSGAVYCVRGADSRRQLGRVLRQQPGLLDAPGSSQRHLDETPGVEWNDRSTQALHLHRGRESAPCGQAVHGTEDTSSDRISATLGPVRIRKPQRGKKSCDPGNA